jgi:hypothetical protein
MTNGKGRRTDEHGIEVHERKTDSDYIARVGAFMTRYKILWGLVIAIGTWYAKNILEPIRISAQTTAQVALINEKIDKQVMPRLDSADADRSRMIRIQEMQGRQLGYLSRMSCLRMSAVERVKADFDCKDIPIEITKGGF